MLPAPYQEELKTIVSDFAAKMDGNLYNRFNHQCAADGFRSSKTQGQVLQASDCRPTPVDRATLEKAWDPAVAIGEALLDSEFYDIEELRKMISPASCRRRDHALPIRFLPSPAPTRCPRSTTRSSSFSPLKNVKASKVSGDDNSQVVKIEIEGKDPIEAEFVKVEGKWIPKIVQENWPTLIQQIKDAVAFSSRRMMEPKREEESSTVSAAR